MPAIVDIVKWKLDKMMEMMHEMMKTILVIKNSFEVVTCVR